MASNAVPHESEVTKGGLDGVPPAPSHNVTFSIDENPHPTATSTISHRSMSLPPREGSFFDRRSQWPRRLSEVRRRDHMQTLIRQRRESMAKLFAQDDATVALEQGRMSPHDVEGGADISTTTADEERKRESEMHSEFVQKLQSHLSKEEAGGASDNKPPMEIRLQNVSYKVPSYDDGSGNNKIQTIYNTSPLYKIQKLIERMKEHGKPEKQYLVTNVLSNVNLVLKPKKMYLILGPPLSGKTSLLKAIAGMLTQGYFPAGYPQENFFTGQVLYNNLVCSGEGADEANRTLFKNLVAFVRQNDAHAPRLTVGETFLFSGCCKDENVRKNNKGVDANGRVGLTLDGLGLSHVKDTFVGSESIRGVSGGQRRRVTLGEMMVFDTPLLCGDEISTGLDAASTVEILRILSYLSLIFNRVSVVSLLQPSPEAVSLFDELILLGAGGNVIFAGPTEDARDYFRQLGYVQPDGMDDADYLLAVASSDRHHLYRPLAASDGEGLGAIKNIAMGLSVGFVFFETDVNSSFFGVLFQGNLFIMLGAMTSAPEKLDDRAIFYKHSDSNFYPALSYIVGQALALVPQMIMDVLLFGTLVYWLVGFTATASGFFLYLLLFFSFNFTMGQLFGLLAAVAPSKTVVQAGGAVILLLNTLFCGYIVSPTVIPDYYIWIYWMMPLAWVYRALLLNEYTSDDEQYADGKGEEILRSFGFLYKGEPFAPEWIWYSFAYLIPFLCLCMIASAMGLRYFRIEPKQKGQPDVPKPINPQEEEDNMKASIHDTPFVPVDLSFDNLCYDVKASTGGETLRLLNNVSGVFSGGRMCALMGESGAGKTTLMDVIALRKRSGTITGDVLLNGFPQEEVSFRRCSGYVEQFDVQSAELTVRETIRFSALLRLDRTNPVFDTLQDTKRALPAGFDNHIENIINTLELTNEADILVGNEAEGGLTFEQRKRLSIAVELAASPSIVFLDEPTSGLDARAALLKGGEVVFFGDLGPCSCKLISYFENLGASPMNKGENPSTWMLNVLGEHITTTNDNGEEEPLDFAQAWNSSPNYQRLKQRLDEIVENRDEKLKIKYDTVYAATRSERNRLVANRLVTIYWRSPAYNLSRMILSLAIAFLLGSVFIPIRKNLVFSETEITSMLSTIFISFIIIGVLSITSVLPVMLSIRDMYYRHKAGGLLGSASVARALATAEKRFILISCVLFCVVFIPTSGIANSPLHSTRERVGESVAFWGFFTFNMAIYSYIGQLFMCLVRGPGTAQILASIFIGINNFFSGLIVRPQQMNKSSQLISHFIVSSFVLTLPLSLLTAGLWAFTYWINPGHFVYEGLCMSIFHNDTRQVIVSEGSDYYYDLNCTAISAEFGDCQVDASEYVTAFFGGKFSRNHIMRNALILGGILFAVRAATFVALSKLTYSGK
eukprot:g13469.t1 g13469   contig8:742113-747102(+)